MFVMGLMMGGACSVDIITANLLPITARHFTSDLTLIGAMVALNRICGFLVQPYVAWKSDGHVSPAGRRRPFLLAAWPATLVSVGLLGALPFLVPVEYQRTTAVIALLFGINLMMQVAVDVCYGTAMPMYGDTFPSRTLGRANAIRSVAANAVLVAMMSVGVPLADRHEFLPYLGAMLLVAIAWAITQFGIKETVPARLPPRGPYHPLRPLGELRNPRTRHAAVIASAALAALALTEMFHALFVTETLALSKTVLGWSATAGIVVSFLCPYPVGLVVDRYGPRSVLIAGFSILLVVEAAFVFWVHDVTSLCVTLVLFNVARVVVQIPIVPLMFHGAPAERRGSIFAGIQMTRAGLASAAMIFGSHFAALAGSYRICYGIAGVVGLVGLVAAYRLMPRRCGAAQEPPSGSPGAEPEANASLRQPRAD
jgi:Na+/melibiose symporter-like transporter